MDTIILKDLANELGMDRSHLRKYAIGHGVELLKVRVPESGNLMMLAVTPENADQIRMLRSEAGFDASQKKRAQIADEDGSFYVVCADPNRRPERIKLGFTNSTSRRMEAYRTICPSVDMLAVYPCKRSWEPAAIASIAAADGCVLVRGEVYDFDHPETAGARAEAFFGVMGNRIMAR